MGARADDRGLFKRGRRWWLAIYIPREGKKNFALRPEGETFATTNKDVARALARNLRRQIRKRIEERGEIEKPTGPANLSELIKQFQAVNAIEGSETQAKVNVSYVRAFVGDCRIKHLEQITLEKIQERMISLKDAKKTPKTLWNHRAGLSRFCGFLVDRGLLESNPCRRVKIPKLEKLLPRFLSPREREEALRMAKEHGIYAEVATALYTGMRREELRRMAWADVDFERAVIMVPKSKSRRPRAIPLASELRKILLDHRHETGKRKHVFPGQYRIDHSGMRRAGWWNDALKPLQKALPIFTKNMAGTATGRGWHLFRHTFASRLVQAGVPIVKISAWLGHASIGTTMIYAHLAPGHDEDIEHV